MSSSGSGRDVYICNDDPEMVCKTPINEDCEYVQEAEIEAYQDYGEEYEMFCPMDLERSSSSAIYMKRADIVDECLNERWEENAEDFDERDAIDCLVEEWDDGGIYWDRCSLEKFYDLAKRTCEAIYGEDEFDGKWLKGEFDKLLGNANGKKAFKYLFADFHSGNYGFITGPEGKHRIVCVDYAGVW